MVTTPREHLSPKVKVGRIMFQLSARNFIDGALPHMNEIEIRWPGPREDNNSIVRTHTFKSLQSQKKPSSNKVLSKTTFF